MQIFSVPVTIINDVISERIESFSALLIASDGFPNNVMLEPVSASANINDDDGKYIQL